MQSPDAFERGSTSGQDARVVGLGAQNEHVTDQGAHC